MQKGRYDPCPVGYRVPNGGNNGIWATSYINHIADNEKVGFYWVLDNDNTAWYPSAGVGGYGGYGYANKVGYLGWAYYWSSTIVENSDYGGRVFMLLYRGERFYGSSGDFNVAYTPDRNGLYSVRCMKE